MINKYIYIPLPALLLPTSDISTSTIKKKNVSAFKQFYLHFQFSLFLDFIRMTIFPS